MATVRTGGLLGAEVEVYGLDGLLSRLYAIGPEAAAALEKDAGAAVQQVTDEARARVHYRTGETFGGYRVRKQAHVVKAVNATRGGMISEFAGSVNPQGKTPRGRTLISTLNAAYGPPGRILWAAWDARAEKVIGEVHAIVAAAEARLRSA